MIICLSNKRHIVNNHISSDYSSITPVVDGASMYIRWSAALLCGSVIGVTGTILLISAHSRHGYPYIWSEVASSTSYVHYADGCQSNT